MQELTAVLIVLLKNCLRLFSTIALLLLARCAYVELAMWTSHQTGQTCDTGTIALVCFADNRTRKTRPTAPPQTVRQAGAQSQPSRVLGTQHGLCSLSSQQIGRCAEYIPRV